MQLQVNQGRDRFASSDSEIDRIFARDFEQVAKDQSPLKREKQKVAQNDVDDNEDKSQDGISEKEFDG